MSLVEITSALYGLMVPHAAAAACLWLLCRAVYRDLRTAYLAYIHRKSAPSRG